MPRGWVSAAVVGRSVALLLLLLAAALGLLGLALFPPLLERFLLAAERLNTAAERAWSSVVALALIAVAVFLTRRALRLWRLAPTLAPARLLGRLLIVGLSTLAALGLAEILARATLPREKVLSGDAYFRHLWMTNRRASQGDRLNPRYPTDRYDSELGWAPRENYRSATLTINSRGLRGRREHPLHRVGGERRIVVVGDSFTFGEDVADEEVFTERLDELLEGTRVVNLGVHGYGTDQQYLRLKRDGFEYEPDLVVLAFYSTNAERNVLSFRDFAKPRFRLEGDRLQLDNVPVPEPTDPSLLGDPGPRSYLMGVVRRALTRLGAHTVFAPRWPLTRALLDAAHDLCRARGTSFTVVYIPAANYGLSPVADAAEVVVRDWAAARNVPFLDLRDAFLELRRKERKRLYKGHLTPRGHRLVAELIAEHIEEHELLDSAGGRSRPSDRPPSPAPG